MRLVVVPLLLCGLMLTGCVNRQSSAPVLDIDVSSSWGASHYTVRKGDSLYSISWSFGYDYQDLAKWNALREPYSLRVGQVLRLTSPSLSQGTSGDSVPVIRGLTRQAPSKANPVTTRRDKPSTHKVPDQVSASVSPLKSSSTKKASQVKTSVSPNTMLPKGRWYWPATGLVQRIVPTKFDRRRGIYIKGHYDSLVRASASGKVVYSGTGVPGYGNLIIIEHTKSLLSAYAFNKVRLVRVGQMVSAGQTIARMGYNPQRVAAVYFELRLNGRPVDPQAYLRRA